MPTLAEMAAKPKKLTLAEMAAKPKGGRGSAVKQGSKKPSFAWAEQLAGGDTRAAEKSVAAYKEKPVKVSTEGAGTKAMRQAGLALPQVVKTGPVAPEPQRQRQLDQMVKAAVGGGGVDIDALAPEDRYYVEQNLRQFESEPTTREQLANLVLMLADPVGMRYAGKIAGAATKTLAPGALKGAAQIATRGAVGAVEGPLVNAAIDLPILADDPAEWYARQRASLLPAVALGAIGRGVIDPIQIRGERKAAEAARAADAVDRLRAARPDALGALERVEAGAMSGAGEIRRPSLRRNQVEMDVGSTGEVRPRGADVEPAAVEEPWKSRTYTDELTESDKNVLGQNPKLAREIAAQDVDEYVARNQHLGTDARLRATHAYASEVVNSTHLTESPEAIVTRAIEGYGPRSNGEIDAIGRAFEDVRQALGEWRGMSPEEQLMQAEKMGMSAEALETRMRNMESALSEAYYSRVADDSQDVLKEISRSVNEDRLAGYTLGQGRTVPGMRRVGKKTDLKGYDLEEIISSTGLSREEISDRILENSIGRQTEFRYQMPGGGVRQFGELVSDVITFDEAKALQRSFGGQLGQSKRKPAGVLNRTAGGGKSGDREAFAQRLNRLGIGGPESGADRPGGESGQVLNREATATMDPDMEMELATAAPEIREPAPGQKPVKLRDIVRKMSKTLAPIRKGRFVRFTEEGEKILGQYKVHEAVVRVGQAFDIPTVAHEIGHHLHPHFFPDADRVRGFTPESIPQQWRQELGMLSGGDPVEGFGEFVRLWVTQPEVAGRAAPTFAPHFEQRLAEAPGIRKVLMEAREGWRVYQSLPDKDKVLATMSIAEADTKRPWTWDTVYANWFDSQAPLKKATEAITGGQPLRTRSDPFKTAWLNRGAGARAEEWLEYGITDRAGNVVGSSLRERLAPVVDRIDDFRAYVTAMHGMDVIDRLGEDAMPLSRAHYERIAANAPADFRHVQQSLVAFRNETLRELVDSGIISNDYYNFLLDKWPNDIGLYQLGLEEKARGGVGGKGMANLANPIKPLHGVSGEIVDPLESLVRDTYWRLNLAAKNRVMQQFVDLSNAFPESGRIMEQVTRPMRPMKVNLNELLSPQELQAVTAAGVNPDKLRQAWKRISADLGQENIVRVWRNGVEEYYQLDPDLYNVVTAMDEVSLHWMVKLMQPAAQVLRTGATLTPAFAIRNPIRDVVTGLINSRYGITAIDLGRGFIEALRKGELYHQWRAAGGDQVSMISVDRGLAQKSLDEVIDSAVQGWKPGTLLKRMKNWGKHYARNVRNAGEGLGDGGDALTMLQRYGAKAKVAGLGVLDQALAPMRAVTETTERMTRLAEFGKGTKWGAERDMDAILEAAIASRDVTIDFGRSGNKGKDVNRIVAFFNAQLQGWEKTARVFKENPVKATARSVAYITLPTLALYAINRNDERYQKLPEWEKDMFWIIPTPSRLWKIPKPFELGLIFGTIPERILRAYDKQDPHAFDGLAESVYDTMMPTLVPTVFVPWIQTLSNRSFTGGPIVPQREQDWPEELQYGPGTSAVGRMAGETLGVSPRKVDALVTGYAGGLGKAALRATTPALEETGIVDTPPRPTRDWAEEVAMITGLGVSKYTPPVQVERMYDELDKLSKEKKRAEAKGVEFGAKDAARLKELNRYKDALGGLRKVEREVQDAEDMAEMKRIVSRRRLPMMKSKNIHDAKREVFDYLMGEQLAIVESPARSQKVDRYRKFRFEKPRKK